MWQTLKDYFSFTKKERNGIISIVSIIIIVSLLPRFFYYFTNNETVDSTEFEKEISQLKIDSFSAKTFSKNQDEYYNDYTPAYKNRTSVKKELFYFDPNTASENDWIRLGVRKRTAQTIQKYIAKGGKFYKPEDIKMIYGLSETDAERLIPYVSILAAKKEFSKNENSFTEKKIYPKKYTVQLVDINVADTSAFIALRGIGNKLSKRIIAFREKLGGFYSVDQIAETYNLPDSTFQNIKKYLIINSKAIKKININLATVDEMRTHPYINYNIANAIYQYRQQHGSFNSVDEIKKIMTINDEFFNKVSPYLSVQ
ncbi:MAG: helix-hairpin-helix domain-containing protein [Bacteroidota bacterium]|nr:helix-hairpin-helix domain-containing protein [Bacteroidota bacterium]